MLYDVLKFVATQQQLISIATIRTFVYHSVSMEILIGLKLSLVS